MGVNRGSLHLEAAGADHVDADMKEVLAQRCHELDTQVRTLIFVQQRNMEVVMSFDYDGYGYMFTVIMF